MELFSLRKRINQRTFLVGYAFYAVLAAGFVVLTNMSGHDPKTQEVHGLLGLAELVYLLGIVLYDLCLIKQRANDINGAKSLWYFALGALLPGFILGFFPSEQAENQYGPVPEAGVHFD